MVEGKLVLIAAVAENGVIGKDGNMPWNIREDLKRFRSMTLKHGVVMGRKTAESLERRCAFPLDKRLNVIISRTQDYSRIWDNVISVGDLNFGLMQAMRYNRDRIGYVIGGGEIYAATINLPETKRLEITRVHQNPEGDVYFPSIDSSIWGMSQYEPHCDNGYSFETWERT